jgi:hypothetical protein
VSLTFRSVLRKFYTEPPIGDSYQIFFHLATQFQKRRFFRNQPIRNKNCLWWPCLLTVWDEMNNRYREPSIDAPYQVWVHLAKQFQRRQFFRNWSIKNRNCLCSPCLLTDLDEISNIYTEPSIDTSWPVSAHLAKRFQIRRFLEIDQSETRIACGGHVC